MVEKYRAVCVAISTEYTELQLNLRVLYQAGVFHGIVLGVQPM